MCHILGQYDRQWEKAWTVERAPILADSGWPSSWRKTNCPPSVTLPKNMALDGTYTTTVLVEQYNIATIVDKQATCHLRTSAVIFYLSLPAREIK